MTDVRTIKSLQANIITHINRVNLVEAKKCLDEILWYPDAPAWEIRLIMAIRDGLEWNIKYRDAEKP